MPAPNALDKLVADLAKRYTPLGSDKPVIQRGGAAWDPVRMIPTSSYALNFLLGGGFAEGKLHEFFGAEHAGKTSLMMLCLRDMFEFYGRTRAIVYVDVEHRWNPIWATNLGLVEGQDLILVQPANAEDAIDMMAELIRSKLVCAVGWDSIGGASTQFQQQTFSDQKTAYGGSASVMTRCVQTVTPVADLFGCTIFFMNQLRADMQGFNRPMTPGGHAIKHLMSTRIYLRRGKEKYLARGPEGDVQVGYPMVFKAVKNTFGPAPREQWSDFYYVPSRHLDHIGFDTQKELQRLGILTGVVTQSGSWYEYQTVKANGRDAFFADLATANLAEQLGVDVMATLGSTIGDFSDLELTPEMRELTLRPEAHGVEIDDAEV